MNNVLKKYGKVLMLACGLLANIQPGYGQYAYFVESGKIEFEKRVNMFAKIKGRVTPDNVLMQQVYDDYRRTHAQFVTSKASLSFNKDQSIYQTAGEFVPSSDFIGREPWVIANNTVLTDLRSDSITIVKKVFDATYTLREKQPQILWKHTNEVREIAGYECKRANGLIQDSIYVVAFYTERLVPAIGPESFSGLPGTILGVVLPHENVTWFATAVHVDRPDPIKAVVLPKNAEEIDRESLRRYLEKNMRNWGTYSDEALKAFLL